MIEPYDIQMQMVNSYNQMITLGDMLDDQPNKQNEAYHFANIINGWITRAPQRKDTLELSVITKFMKTKKRV